LAIRDEDAESTLARTSLEKMSSKLDGNVSKELARERERARLRGE
jgi:hypothetical protein